MELKCLLMNLIFFVLSSDFSFTEVLVVEETSHFTLACRIVSDTRSLVVTYDNNANETIAVFTRSVCTVSRGDINCFILDNSLIVVEVEVTSQTRTIVSYTCGGCPAVNITFYARPSNVSCGQPTLDESSTNVIVTCAIGKIYPQPRCLFYDTRTDRILAGSNPPVKYVPWGNPIYFKAECSIQIAVSNQTEVHQDIRVYVQPDYNNSSMELYGVNYTVAWPLIIEPVSVAIDSTCPLGAKIIQGFIKIGTTATCKCIKTTSAPVLGRVHWYRDNRQVPSSETDSSSILTVSYPTDVAKSFQCKASPVASDPNGITFNPQFAYGPQNILVDFNKTTIDLCMQETKIIHIEAWVPKYEVSPDISVTAVKSSSNRNEAYAIPIRTTDNILSSNITSTIFLTVTSGGPYVVTVTFTNTIFNDLIARTNISVDVREPPKMPPIFLINGGDPLHEGITTSNVNVTCYAPGGYPDVSEVTISCAGQNTNKSGNRLTVMLDFETKDNDSECFCKAIHKSGCYNNNLALAIVNITHVVNITSFVANNQTQPEVNEGESVTLSCLVESYPRPVLVINAKDITLNDNTLLTAEPTEVEANLWRCQYIFFGIKCEDAHNYTCKATQTFSKITVESNVYINVKCHFRMRDHTKVNEDIGAILGQDLIFTLDVLGNPPPTRYWLLRGLTKYPVENGSFNVEFTPLNFPFGTLKLTLFNIQRKNMTLFSLVIDNGMKENMTHSFLVFETTTGSDSPNIGLIIGCVLGGVIVILLVLVSFLLYQKRCKITRRQPENGTHVQASSTPNDLEHPSEDDDTPVKEIYERDKNRPTENGQNQPTECRAADDGNLYDDGKTSIIHKQENSDEVHQSLQPENRIMEQNMAEVNALWVAFLCYC